MRRLTPRLLLSLFAWLLVVPVLAPVLASASNPGDPPDARGLWERSLAVQRLQTLRGEALLHTQAASGNAAPLEIRFATRVGPDGWGRSIIDRVESAGPLHGSSFLTLETRGNVPRLWIYLPALGAPRRIVGSNLGDSYFGSEFAYAEFLQPRVEDFDVRLLGEEPIDGTKCWKLEALPSTGREQGTGYGKRLLWIRHDNHVERRILYHDPAGRPLKVMDTDRVVEAPPPEVGKWIALERRMRNLRSGQVSIATFHRITADPDIDAALFSPQHLSQQLW